MENSSSGEENEKISFLDLNDSSYGSIRKIIHSKEKLSESDVWIAGIDEAGRGSVSIFQEHINIGDKKQKIGPMVYSIAYCPRNYGNILKKYGFSDSKTLTPEQRKQLMQMLYTNNELKKNVGWSISMVSARKISEGMLQPDKSYNLNAQAHDTTIQLLSEIYIDTVGPSSSYQVKLQQLFPQANIIVKEKADSIYPIVSTASICAKVSRDNALAKAAIHQESWGSGYPSGNNSLYKNSIKLIYIDPITCKWLKNTMDPIFGWPYEIVRYSWQTAKDLLEKDAQKRDNLKVYVEWYKRNEKNTMRTIQSYSKASKIAQEGINLSWYGQNIEHDF
ncbi:hypothetical protein PMAC_002407 [Pneumocystis sp. 'macacae']|nr:hypothetical protein PMAC_002407 [Pneumocystis sp. 'macacae']